MLSDVFRFHSYNFPDPWILLVRSVDLNVRWTVDLSPEQCSHKPSCHIWLLGEPPDLDVWISLAHAAQLTYAKQQKAGSTLTLRMRKNIHSNDKENDWVPSYWFCWKTCLIFLSLSRTGSEVMECLTADPRTSPHCDLLTSTFVLWHYIRSVIANNQFTIHLFLLYIVYYIFAAIFNMNLWLSVLFFWTETNRLLLHHLIKDWMATTLTFSWFKFKIRPSPVS